jgi:hypothetical protein
MQGYDTAAQLASQDIAQRLGYLGQASALDYGQNAALQQDAVNAYNFQQMAPWQTLSNYMGAIGSPFGTSGTSSSSAPIYRNPVATGVGNATSLGVLGAGIGSAFPGIGTGIGGAIGGGLGLLSGLF